MALVLVKEDGTGRADANAYASEADGDAYHAGHLYASAWTSASVDRKAAALVEATRLIDAYCSFVGFRKTSAQGLQWPRVEVPDVEALNGVLPDNAVPKCVLDATCEQARELLIADRTGTPLGEGLTMSTVSGSQFVFDKADRRPVLSGTVKALLRRVVSWIEGGACVRLQRG